MNWNRSEQSKKQSILKKQNILEKFLLNWNFETKKENLTSTV